MKMYLTTIGVAMVAIAAVNIACGVAPWYYVIIATIWCTALQFALDAVVAIGIRLTSDRHYGADDPRFTVSERDQEFYKKIKVRLWKDKVWELGSLGGFSKRKLADPDDPAYIEKFIVECNRGVVTHRLSYPIGFLAMLTMFNVCTFTIALPVALVNLWLNILPTIVLRYNTPKLQRMLKRMKRKQER